MSASLTSGNTSAPNAIDSVYPVIRSYSAGPLVSLWICSMREREKAGGGPVNASLLTQLAGAGYKPYVVSIIRRAEEHRWSWLPYAQLRAAANQAQALGAPVGGFSVSMVPLGGGMSEQHLLTVVGREHDMLIFRIDGKPAYMRFCPLRPNRSTLLLKE